MINGKYTVIDAHCHVYPQKVLPRAVEATGKFYLEPPYHDGTVSGLIEYGKAAGIDKFIIESVATTKEQVRRINAFIAETVVEHGDIFTGLGTVHPESDDMRADLLQVKELGLKGIKIHPDIQGFAADCDGFERAYDICGELDLTVLMHTGDVRYDLSNPNRIVPLLGRHPEVTFVGAHLGGWSMWDTAVNDLAGIPNFYVDTSSAISYISPEKGREVIRRYGADRVLFGTDYPLHNVTQEVENVMALGLDEDEYRLILCENAKKIYGL